jgi:hypothetical protein
MNREIKFRAWDKTTNTGMLSCDWKWLGERADHISDYILMQYTGLKDKNGKEIYEGDVISLGKHPYEVGWGEDGFESYYGYTGVVLRGAYEESTDSTSATKWEIIGNIYENPELLTKKEIK